MGKNWLECDILGRESFRSGKCLLNINTVKSCIIKILLIESRGILFRSWRTCKAIQFLEWNLGLRSEINPGKPFYTCTFLESLWMSIITHSSHHEVLPGSCFSCTGNPPGNLTYFLLCLSHCQHWVAEAYTRQGPGWYKPKWIKEAEQESAEDWTAPAKDGPGKQGQLGRVGQEGQGHP